MHDLDYAVPDKRARNWAMACHLGGLVWLTCLPLSWIVVPWVIWLTARHDHPYIDEQGREAVNFQITLTICNALVALAIWFLSFVFFGWLLTPFAAILFLGEIAGVLYAAYQVSRGEPFRYPLTIRFL